VRQQRLVRNPESGRYETVYVDCGPSRVAPRRTFIESEHGYMRAGRSWTPLGPMSDPTEQMAIANVRQEERQRERATSKHR
jgi:hypothetical protein